MSTSFRDRVIDILYALGAIFIGCLGSSLIVYAWSKQFAFGEVLIPLQMLGLAGGLIWALSDLLTKHEWDGFAYFCVTVFAPFTAIVFLFYLIHYAMEWPNVVGDKLPRILQLILAIVRAAVGAYFGTMIFSKGVEAIFGHQWAIITNALAIAGFIYIVWQSTRWFLDGASLALYWFWAGIYAFAFLPMLIGEMIYNAIFGLQSQKSLCFAIITM